MTPAADNALRERAADVRVTLVGRSAAEAVLRRDPGVELLRARDPLHAIGELAFPVDDESPAASVALVARGVVPAEQERDLLAAMRRVAPGALVVSLGHAEPGLYDARLDEREADGERLRDLLARRSRGPRAAPTPAAAPAPRTPLPTPPSPRDAGGPAPADDPGVIAALLAGADVLEPCLAVLRARLDDATIAFLPGVDADDDAPGDAPVERRGQRFGMLRADRADAPALGRAADWLAHWLALRDQHAALRDAAFTDPLTGVWNRRYFERFLARAIDLARERRQEVALLLVDIDNFKSFNDLHGHAAGDEILRETVRLLRSVIRPTDRVCRVGGDEFAVIFHDPEGPRAPAADGRPGQGSRETLSISGVCARFQEQVRAQRFPKLGEHAPGRLTISGGLATFPWDAADPESLLARADALALAGKGQGKNVIVFGPGAAGGDGAGRPQSPDPA